MDIFPRLQDMLDAALRQAALDGGMLLGHELEVKEAEASTCAKNEYIKKIEDASFIIGVRCQEEYEGLFYLVFSLRDAIVFGSLLLGVPLARVSEKKKLAIIDSDDMDAFSEFTNQVIGSFNPIFKANLPKKAHLKLLDSQKFIPEGKETAPDTPVPDGEYFVYRAQLFMQAQDLDRLDILIPLALAEGFDPPEAAAAETDEVESTVEEEVAATTETGCEPNKDERTVLILEDNSADRQFFQETFTSTDIRTIAAELDADLSGFFPNPPVKAVILGVTEADDHEFSICIKIRTMSQKGAVPVIMCAREWTRTSVLKALKYGASDIIIKPCTPDELRSKVLKHMLAA